MKLSPLSNAGLTLAAAASIMNVALDIAVKNALRGRSFLQTTVRIRAVVAIALTLVLGGCWQLSTMGHLPAAFRPAFSALLNGKTIAVLLLSTGLVTVSILLYYRSLQTAPLSITAPMFGFTPVFILVMGFLLFHHLPSVRVIAGVFCILLGSLQAHWTPALRSARTAWNAFLRERGVRLMLIACVLLSITNLLDQRLVARLNVLTYAWLYSVLCAAFTSLLLPGRRTEAKVRRGWRWILIAAAVDTTALLLQFASLQYVDVVVTIAIKRSGMLLSVAAGSILFKEARGRQRLAAAVPVVIGVLMIYFDLRHWVLFAACSIAALASAAAFRIARQTPLAEADLGPLQP